MVAREFPPNVRELKVSLTSVGHAAVFIDESGEWVATPIKYTAGNGKFAEMIRKTVRELQLTVTNKEYWKIPWDN